MKKTAAVILTLALALAATAIPVYAADPAGSSDAGIDFIHSDKPPVIIDPPEEPDPDAGIFKGIYDRGIYFGEWTASATTEIYKSIDNKSTVDTQFVGSVVENANPTYDWKLQVQVGGFKTKVGELANLENFALKLVPDVDSAVSNNGTVRATANEITLRQADTNAQTIFSAKENGIMGRYGQNWSGELTVPFGSVAHTGESYAVMTWTFTAA